MGAFRLRGVGPALAAAIALGVLIVVAGVVRVAPHREGAGSAHPMPGNLWLAYAAGSSLYGEPPPAGGAHFELVRYDTASGRVLARRPLSPPAVREAGGAIAQPDPEAEAVLLAAGSLWVLGTDSQHTWLWRLDPGSLAVRSLALLPGGGAGGSGSMAVAGGWLWVVNVCTLVRVSLATGHITGSRVFANSLGGHGNTVGADAGGRALVLTIGGNATNGNAGSRVERLDPATGGVLARSRLFPGYTPAVDAVAGGTAWIGGLTNLGGPERLDLRTLRPTASVGNYNDSIRRLGGVLWLTGGGRSACLDPVTLRARATLPTIVAGAGSTVYVLRRGSTAGIAVPAECR